MKHLKYFKENKKNLYEIISHDKFKYLLNDKHIETNITIKEKIERSLNISLKDGRDFEFLNHGYKKFNCFDSKRNTIKNSVKIFPLMDEYFLIKINFLGHSEYISIDGYDGLKKAEKIII